MLATPHPLLEAPIDPLLFASVNPLAEIEPPVTVNEPPATMTSVFPAVTLERETVSELPVLLASADFWTTVTATYTTVASHAATAGIVLGSCAAVKLTQLIFPLASIVRSRTCPAESTG